MTNDTTRTGPRRRQPFADVLAARVLSHRWLAVQTGYSHVHVRAVAAGTSPSSARFRARVAGALGLPEASLFVQSGDSSAPPSDEEGESVIRAGTAVVTGIYRVSEAPSIVRMA